MSQPLRASSRFRHPFVAFLVRRTAAGIATLWVVSVLVFIGTEVLPGDTATALLGRNANPAAVAELRERMGLDRSVPDRYFDWLGGLLTGDLGNTAAGDAAGQVTPIWSEVKEKASNSLTLALITAALMMPISLALGILAAKQVGRALDHAISAISLALVALPEFVLGTFFVLAFFSWLDILPPVSLVPPGTAALARPSVLVLPVLTLLGVTTGAAIRMVRAGMIETLRSDYVEMARLNGFRESKVILRYALPNALGPSIQIFAQNIQYLIGGVIVIEYLFSYPGLGRELVDAVAIRDVRVVQSVAILIAAVYIGLNVLADLAVVLLTPKLRTQP